MVDITAGAEQSWAGSASDAVLGLEGISASYGGATVLRNVSISVPHGSLVALLGGNGAGKTTLLRVAAGVLRPTAGRVWLNSRDVTRYPSHRRVREGLCLVPEGRGIFPSLSVQENLELQVPPWIKQGKLDRVRDIFPVLDSRRHQVAGTLSGGEQQMLALARAVLAEPQVILLDEISMGLAPRMVDQLFEALGQLASLGTSMLLVEQYVHRALEMCSIAYILRKGEVAYSGQTADLQRETVIESYIGPGWSAPE